MRLVAILAALFALSVFAAPVQAAHVRNGKEFAADYIKWYNGKFLTHRMATAVCIKPRLINVPGQGQKIRVWACGLIIFDKQSKTYVCGTALLSANYNMYGPTPIDCQRWLQPSNTVR